MREFWSDISSRRFWVTGVLASAIASILVALGWALFERQGGNNGHTDSNAVRVETTFTPSVGIATRASTNEAELANPTSLSPTSRVPTPTNIAPQSPTVSPPEATAMPAGILSSGDVISLTFDRPGQTMDWHFAGEKDQLLLVRMDKDPSGNIEPVLTLYDPFGNRVADANTFLVPNDAYAQLRYTLVSTGQFRLRAEDETGKGLGPFVLRFAIDPFVPIVFGQTLDGLISLPGEDDLYIFDALAGQSVTIRMDRDPSGNLEPSIDLYDPFGKRVKSGSSFLVPADAYAELEIDLQSSGRFTIDLRDDQRKGLGAYTVTLSLR